MFAVLFFSEAFRLRSLVGLAACLSGAVLILYDGSAYPILGSLLVLLAAVFRGFAANFLRLLRAEGHSSYIVYLSACVCGLPLTAPFAGEVRHVNAQNVFPILFISAIMFAAQVLMSWGFKHTTAVKGGLLYFLVVPLTVGLSVILVDEVITVRFLVGAGIIAAGLVVATIFKPRAAS